MSHAHPVKALRVEGLGKQYTLGRRESHGALRDALARVGTFAWAKGSASRRERERIWALRDVSFDVNEGAVVGIIGRNGSGKSTLLKILSRITEPTTGEATVRGRVGALLEVGTGFHPELTGRENVFVNGAILGMKRRDIAARFDAIVDFAGVASFIDTPVKHYSSGMHVRLAFAVAAHLEPHILLVDEVLAVGDAEFQKRCLGKMQDVSRQGRTVVLVSHQLGQIRRLCDTVMWLDRGSIQAIGPAAATIRAYESAIVNSDAAPAPGQCFAGWSLAGGGHVLTDSTQPFALRLQIALEHEVRHGHLGVSVCDADDAVMVGWAFEPVHLAAGRHVLDVRVPQLPLRPGSYRLSLALFDGGSNLTGGRLIEKWSAAPELTLDTPPVAHPQDEWAGVLNIPASLDHVDS